MKSTGIVRRIDKLNRFVLPKELCRKLDIKGDQDSLEIFTENDMIIMKKYQPSCIFCNEANNVISFKDKLVCRACAEELDISIKEKNSESDL